MTSTESTGFNIKHQTDFTTCNTTENKSSSVQNNQDDQEGIKCKLTEIDYKICTVLSDFVKVSQFTRVKNSILRWRDTFSFNS